MREFMFLLASLICGIAVGIFIARDTCQQDGKDFELEFKKNFENKMKQYKKQFKLWAY